MNMIPIDGFKSGDYKLIYFALGMLSVLLPYLIDYYKKKRKK